MFIDSSNIYTTSIVYSVFVCSLDTLYKLLYTLVIHWRTYMMLCQEEHCSFGIPRDLV